MLINTILKEDIIHCKEALNNDFELRELEIRFYELLEGVNENKFKLEDVFSAFIAKCIRIAYLQGMKDFAELYVVLKLDVQDILAMLK